MKNPFEKSDEYVYACEKHGVINKDYCPKCDK
jgi:hypothetical protein